MSTRCYPLYIKGNPQLRVFLSNFWMKLVKPKIPMPPNHVQFIVSMEMTKYDVKNYLEKIYKVPVKEVRTMIKMGEFRRVEGYGYIVKDDDYKIAYVQLPQDQKFEFPNLFPEESKKEEEKELKIQQEGYEKFLERKGKNWQRPGIPFWFGT